MAKYRSYGFECPRCLEAAYTRHTGRANDGAIVLRRRHCTQCGHNFLTMESVAPEAMQKSIPYYDQNQQVLARERKRRIRAIKGPKTNRKSPEPRPMRQTPRVRIVISEDKGVA